MQWSRARVIYGSAICSALLSLAFFAPRFWLWPLAGLPLDEFIAIQPEFHRAFHALRQLENPFIRIDDPVNRVIEWRLFWPAVGHLLGLSSRTFLVLPHVGAVLVLVVVASIAWRTTRSPWPTFSATLLTATSSWFFVATGWLAYFDSWLILALILAAFGRSRWVIVGAALIAPWIDERFILAVPLCLAVRALAVDRDLAPSAGELLRDAGILLAAILPYLVVRMYAEWSGDRATSGSYWSTRTLLPAPLTGMAWGVWNGLRLGWIVVSLVAISAFRRRTHRAAFVVIFATIALNLCVADDISRSASVAVPAVLAALLLAWRDREFQSGHISPILCLGNLVLPAQHVIASPPGASIAYHCVPILGADAEIERRRNPPEFAAAATYTKRAMDHFQNRNMPRAAAAAEIAVRLESTPGRALANRGIIRYLTGDQAAGTADLERALEKTPHLYDARIQRAAFRQQAGDFHGALEDVRQALQFMPDDWPRRREAQEYERTLAARVGR